MRIHSDNPRLFAFAALGLLAAIGIAHFVPVNPYLGPVLNAGHGLAFLVVTLLAYVAARRWLQRPRMLSLVLASIATAALATVLEAVQFFTPRDADIGDLARDIGGVVLAFAYVRWRWHGTALSALPRWSQVGAVLALLLIAQPLVTAGIGFVARESRQPVFITFDSVLERLDYRLLSTSGRVHPSTERWPGRTGNALRIETRPQRNSGIDLRHVAFDWSPWRCLIIDTAVDDPEEIELTVIATDRHGTMNDKERYRRRFPLTRGEHVIRIAAAGIVTADDTPIELDHLFGLRLTYRNEERGGTVWIDEVKMSAEPCIDSHHSLEFTRTSSATTGR